MPSPGRQGKRAAAALSQAGRAGPDQLIRAIQPADRTRRLRMYATDVRQTDVRRQTASSLNAPQGGGIIIIKFI